MFYLLAERRLAISSIGLLAILLFSLAMEQGAVLDRKTDTDSKLHSSKMTCDPFLGEALMLKNFGTSMEIKDPKEGYFFGISFEGQEIFKNAVETMARLAEEALEESGS